MVDGTLLTVEGRAVLRFERRLAHPRQKVWRAITEPAELEHWFPAAMEGDREVGAPLRFVHAGGEGPTLEGEVTEFDPPRVFAFSWGESLLRLELRPDPDGCTLVFTQTFDELPSAASYAVGWETCLDALARALDGTPVERPVPDRYARAARGLRRALRSSRGHRGGRGRRLDRALRAVASASRRQGVDRVRRRRCHRWRRTAAAGDQRVRRRRTRHRSRAAESARVRLGLRRRAGGTRSVGGRRGSRRRAGHRHPNGAPRRSRTRARQPWRLGIRTSSCSRRS